MSAISDKIKAADDRAEKLVDVPEWDVKILLIAPTSVQRTHMLTTYTEDVVNPQTHEVERVINRDKMMPALVVACAYDPDTRERAFEDADREWLAEKNGAVVERVGMMCMPLVGFVTNKDDEGPTDSGKDDSSTTRSVDTRSDSPVTSAAP